MEALKKRAEIEALKKTAEIEALKKTAEIEALKKTAPSEDHQKLESQVNHYKTVLAQTESMLTSLQSSVEAEEGQWRNKLEVANNEIKELKIKVSSSSNG